MTVLAAARVVTGHEVYGPGWVQYYGDRIVAVGPGLPATVDRDLGDAVVVPGFVDIHVHGGGGGAFTTGDVTSARHAVDTHRRHGTTTTMASLVSASPDALLHSVSMLAELVDADVIAGVHLEGPWISPRRCGAHDPSWLREPDTAEIARLLTAGRGSVRMVTLAPELPGALHAISQIVAAGAVAAAGHTDADHARTVEAVAAGTRVATHLFNAMPPLHHRRPGPVAALLDDPRVTVELIVDGTHVHPATYRHVNAVAGDDRVALVTDAMAAAALGDGRYRLGPLTVTVTDGVAHVAGTTTLAGSTVTMDQVFRAAAHDGSTAGPGPPDPPRRVSDAALLRAARQTSVNPARAVGWTEVGGLRPGTKADLVVLDPTLHVTAVLRHGVDAFP